MMSNDFRYRIGPFEVESALIEHDAVAEAAVVSSPDSVRGEVSTPMGSDHSFHDSLRGRGEYALRTNRYG